MAFWKSVSSPYPLFYEFSLVPSFLSNAQKSEIFEMLSLFRKRYVSVWAP